MLLLDLCCNAVSSILCEEKRVDDVLSPHDAAKLLSLPVTTVFEIAKSIGWQRFARLEDLIDHDSMLSDEQQRQQHFDLKKVWKMLRYDRWPKVPTRYLPGRKKYFTEMDFKLDRNCSARELFLQTGFQHKVDAMTEQIFVDSAKVATLLADMDSLIEVYGAYGRIKGVYMRGEMLAALDHATLNKLNALERICVQSPTLQSVEKLCAILGLSCTMGEVSMRHAMADDAIVEHLLNYLAAGPPTHIKRLDIDACRFSESVAFTVFPTAIKNLEMLRLCENRMQGSAISKMLPSLESCLHLRWLNISDNQLTDSHIALLCSAISALDIRKLQLRGNLFGSQGLQCIAHYAVKRGSLELLDIAENQIGNEGAEFIDSILQNEYNEVEIEIDYSGTKRKVKSKHKGVSKLRHLNVSDCDIGVSGFKTIFHNDGSESAVPLQDFIYSKNIGSGTWMEGWIISPSMRCLQVLDVSWLQLNTNAIVALVKQLSQLQGLKYLDMAANMIRDEGVSQIAVALEKSFVALEQLGLAGNRITIIGISEITARLALRQSRRLKALDLQRNILGASGNSQVLSDLRQLVRDVLISHSEHPEVSDSANQV